MINGKRKLLEDCERNVNANALIFAGAPVMLNAASEVVQAANTDVVYGLSEGDKNQYRDDTYGEFAAFGSGRMGVAKQGIWTVSPSVYDTVAGSTSIFPYDKTLTYAIQDRLYVSSTGLITNASVANVVVDGTSNFICTNFIGKVVKAPSGTNTEMDIDLKC